MMPIAVRCIGRIVPGDSEKRSACCDSRTDRYCISTPLWRPSSTVSPVSLASRRIASWMASWRAGRRVAQSPRNAIRTEGQYSRRALSNSM